jgi:hypothetical protein
LKAPSLLAITIDCQRLLPQRLKNIIHDEHLITKNTKCICIKVFKEETATGGYLSNEITDNTAVINAHARTICVKDPGNPYLNKKTS